MKNFKTIAVALFLSVGTLAVTAQNKAIDVKKSSIKWVGKKVSGSHEGNVDFKSGTLALKGGKLSGGSFVVDMTSIKVTDLEAGKGKEKLEGHLKNDDFFATDKNPTAKIDFKTVQAKANNVYTVTADLTIKGKTAPVTFDLTLGKNTATTAFKIDRAKYDVKYASKSFFDSLGDNVIYDDFDVTVNLVF
ncbi:YceI family protein [Flavobacterium selenitireducens]|uniref:YceI family protein n=1 Tax=Flavobacterium selenitireducens TaxID=2722704 RepID=UPI00168BC501|nr:YceI family protein [Flavobacterium selenitireducens]MBD3583827.1 YceI family protein [Flavobacterium selenitireducens]